jgi:hypothetical protein
MDVITSSETYGRGRLASLRETMTQDSEAERWATHSAEVFELSTIHYITESVTSDNDLLDNLAHHLDEELHWAMRETIIGYMKRIFPDFNEPRFRNHFTNVYIRKTKEMEYDRSLGQ